MTADEIRNCPTPAQQFRLNEVSPGFAIDAVAEFLREIAAQLAEKNAALRESIELQKESLDLQKASNAAQQKVVESVTNTSPLFGFLSELRKEFREKLNELPWSDEEIELGIMAKLEVAIAQTALKLEAK